jgi:hypothetical protein
MFLIEPIIEFIYVSMFIYYNLDLALKGYAHPRFLIVFVFTTTIFKSEKQVIRVDGGCRGVREIS